MLTCPDCGAMNQIGIHCSICGFPLSGQKPTVQRVLKGRYEILETIGHGGMGEVYKARDLITHKIVAIKEMNQSGLAPDVLKVALESFTFEADTLRRLHHPNMPQFYEQLTENSRQYLVMDFIQGQTLEERLKAAGGDPLPEAEVLDWARQLCEVLTYLHTQKPPVIFRDLKLTNIMVTSKGDIYLIDFGIARVFTYGRSKDTQLFGSPWYAPPEQYGGAQTDARSDLYALGRTLFELLTAYDTETPTATPFSLPKLRSRNPAITPQVESAIERATKANRDERYPTVADFATDLLANPPAPVRKPPAKSAISPNAGPSRSVSPAPTVFKRPVRRSRSSAFVSTANLSGLPASYGLALGIIGLALGIIYMWVTPSTVTVLTAFGSTVIGCGGPLGLLGIILSGLACRSVRERRMAIFGLALSVIALAICIGIWAHFN